jgi:hypothetical protein
MNPFFSLLQFILGHHRKTSWFGIFILATWRKRTVYGHSNLLMLIYHGMSEVEIWHPAGAHTHQKRPSCTKQTIGTKLLAIVDHHVLLNCQPLEMIHEDPEAHIIREYDIPSWW